MNWGTILTNVRMGAMFFLSLVAILVIYLVWKYRGAWRQKQY